MTLERGIEVSQAGTKSSLSLSSGVILFESHSVAMWYMGQDHPSVTDVEGAKALNIE